MTYAFLKGVVSRALGKRSKTYYSSPSGYWDARHRRHHDTLVGVGHVGLTDAQNRLDYEAKWQQIKAVLEPVLEAARADGRPSQSSSLLDAGCGVGWFTAKFVELGFDVSGADFAPTAIAIARQRLGDGVPLHVSPLEELAPGRLYDVVTCVDVLFHVVDDAVWARTVNRLASLVVPDGRLVVQEHLVPEPQVVAEQPTQSTHCRWRSIDRYRAALGESWAIEKHHTYQLPEEKSHKDLLVFRRA